MIPEGLGILLLKKKSFQKVQSNFSTQSRPQKMRGKGGREEDKTNMCIEVYKVEKTSLFILASVKCPLKLTRELHRETGRFLFLE